MNQDKLRKSGPGEPGERFSATSKIAKRVNISWDFFRLDNAIGRGEDQTAQVMWAQAIMDAIQGARAWGTFGSVANALAAVAYTDAKNQDHALGVVNADTRWNNAAGSEGRIIGTGAAGQSGNFKGWNRAKIWTAQNMARRGHLGSRGSGMPIVVTSHAALDGFYDDVLSVHKDYSSPFEWGPAGQVMMADNVYSGFRWAAVGDPPDGTESLPTANVGGKLLEDSFIVDPSPLCITNVTLEGQPMHMINIYESEDDDELRFRYLGIYGTGVINPKGIIPVRNLIPGA